MKSLKGQGLISQISLTAAELLKGAAVAIFLAFFFYGSWLAVLPMMLPAGLLLWWDRKLQTKERIGRMRQQFSECVLSVEGAVKAGYAAENAFVESMKDMEMMYGTEAEIIKELRLIKGGLLNNIPLERLLFEMGRRTHVEEIIEFAEIFAITKRNGGQLADIIHMTVLIINGRIETEEEIRTLLASKRLEQGIMKIMPFLLVLYIRISTPGYFDMYFGTWQGVAIMTVYLIWYLAAYILSEYIIWHTGGRRQYW